MVDHIVRGYDEELEGLDRCLSQMGGLVEAQLTDVLTAISQRDSATAQRIVASDARIDALNRDVDALVVRLLALRQPVAIDLRRIVSALRIAGELERMGDYAANLGKRTIALNQAPRTKPAELLPRMGKLVLQICKDVLDAVADRDLDKARRVWERDEEVDELYTSLFHEVLATMSSDPVEVTSLVHVLFMAKNIERIGDHATNIAEAVHFTVLGSTFDASRPKGDSTSFTGAQDIARLKALNG